MLVVGVIRCRVEGVQRRVTRERSKKTNRQGVVVQEILAEASDTSDSQEERTEVEQERAGEV